MQGFKFLILLILSAALITAEKESTKSDAVAEAKIDLDTSPTSAKLFNLGSLFGQNPNTNYPYGYGSYIPNTNYRPQYPVTGGYYPSTYYPSSGWTGTNYYPNQGYYGNTGTGTGYYPSYPTTGSYYPSTGYYPSGGTNILGGNGGYGGYGGNGGLRQYSGYWNPEYTGHRNRGYGFFKDTDYYGLPRNWRGADAGAGADAGGSRGRGRGYNDNDSFGRERDRVPGSYRGYD